jgi:hypothetical protein
VCIRTSTEDSQRLELLDLVRADELAVDEHHLARLDAMPGDHGLQCLEQLVDGGIAVGMDL